MWNWRHGQTPHLETVAAVTPARLTDALEVFRRWAHGRDLRPSEVDHGGRRAVLPRLRRPRPPDLPAVR
ncbi:hypothetical protein [Actinoplanes sp. HUAS TT8]|uniref:hypothetical protein n=1 Tax=Actinoplanes sp. HUAS TT8 TaxID=3447453 RepID=UPI003F528E9B